MGASDLLAYLRGSGFTLTLTDEGGIGIAPAAALTDDDRQAIRDQRSDLLVLLTESPASVIATPDPDRWCWPHSDAMNSAELAEFMTRRARLMRWGWVESAAEALAERLAKRGRDTDDRVSCTDCQHYRPGRCGNHDLAGLQAPDLSRDLAGLLQRCPGFTA